MQEMHGLKNEIIDLRQNFEFTQKNLEEKVDNVEKRMEKLDSDIQEIYEYQIDPKYIQEKAKNIILNLTCWPPNDDAKEFEKHLNKTLSTNYILQKVVIIAGDFNLISNKIKNDNIFLIFYLAIA